MGLNVLNIAGFCVIVVVVTLVVATVVVVLAVVGGRFVELHERTFIVVLEPER
jgi:hypothetical protein